MKKVGFNFTILINEEQSSIESSYNYENEAKKPSITNGVAHVLLKLFTRAFNNKPNRHKYLIKDHKGQYINWSIGFYTKDSHVRKALIFKNGHVSISSHIPTDVNTVLEFPSTKQVWKMISATPDEMLNMVRMGEIVIRGNSVLGTLFNFYISLIMGKSTLKKLNKRRIQDIERVKRETPITGKDLSQNLRKRQSERLMAKTRDPGVKFLSDPYLSKYEAENFPRLMKFLEIHFTKKPEICPERAKILTDWFKENGFESKNNGTPWIPELRQANAYKYLMENRKPIIRKWDLLAGTTTTKEIGVVLYPDLVGTIIWGELNSVPNRILNPYDISEETREILHHDVFPFWVYRNLKEWVRKKYGDPIYQQLDDRFAVYFLWKTVSLSHTIADFPKLLSKGTTGIIKDIRTKLENLNQLAEDNVKEKRNTLEAMILCLQGLNAYAKNLSIQAAKEAEEEKNPDRKAELIQLSEIYAKIPIKPAETLDEAVNIVWIGWVGLHMENTNAGLSIGRLDQWLQPYFESDMKKLMTENDKEEYIKHAIELCGCFYMRCTDHLPLIPDIGNYLFGGSSSDQAITLGGITPDGEDAVNDMTYILLKVTEILNIRDPNINARYHPDKNSDLYLKRLGEVNYITAATPSMHNDKAVINALQEFDYKIEDLRDWSATGCVEPTLSGKHMGHTNSMMMSIVAALEMALNNGKHPLMNWEIGPKTGKIENGSFTNFDEFFKAFKSQYKFLIDMSVEYNNVLGLAHQYIRPTPLLSSLIEGTISKGKDVTKGGARYNSSGVACIGLADVTDSLMAIKKLVFDEKKISFRELKHAIDTNFQENPSLYAMVRKKVPLFGSGSSEAVEMANKIVDFTHHYYGSKKNYRGGPYTAGFWSMSNHVAFGNLAGALPSGRLAGKAFTPGLTPQAHASSNLLDNIKDVAKLHMDNITNNMAFNVKVVPGRKDSHADVVEHIFNYVKTYFELGGMQMQLNVVTSDMLRDAMVHPENYRNLLVRISGYNAYFVTLNRDMQLELIERAEYGI